ncbi:MAG: hypothetical protein OEY59_03625 [Deltaproteobacteria bacterium]|nr:hypothetical protein [Deltaproteobacteria bacterium]
MRLPGTHLSKQLIPTFLSLVGTFFFFQMICLSAATLNGPNKLTRSNQADIEKNADQIFQIFKALSYENKNQFHKANRIWLTFPNSSNKVKTHLILNSLTLKGEVAPPLRIETKEQYLLVLRYFIWRGDWEKAREITEQLSKIGLQSDEIRLETIRLNLLLGNYEKTKSLLESFDSHNKQFQLQKDILLGWYFVLIENEQKASRQLLKIESNYLYIPFHLYFPGEVFLKSKDTKLILNKMMIRFPTDNSLFEIYSQNLIAERDWEALKNTLDAQEDLLGLNRKSLVRADIPLSITQKSATPSDLNEEKPQSADHYDLQARLALQNNQWEKLKIIAQLYKKHFPNLIDGDLYLVAYFEKIGEKEKADKILKRLRLKPGASRSQ